MEEIWKEINGFNGKYEISSFGRVKSLKNNNEKILKPYIIDGGYHAIKLYEKSKKYFFKIHRLVAKYFIENYENKDYVNHKDGNKINNNYLNLEWVTSSENNLHSYRILGRIPPMSGKYGKNNPSSKPILRFTKDGQFIKRYDSAKEAGDDIGINASNIRCCANGKRKSAGKSIWLYENNIERSIEHIMGNDK